MGDSLPAVEQWFSDRVFWVFCKLSAIFFMKARACQSEPVSHHCYAQMIFRNDLFHSRTRASYMQSNVPRAGSDPALWYKPCPVGGAKWSCLWDYEFNRQKICWLCRPRQSRFSTERTHRPETQTHIVFVCVCDFCL
jgi:hypothetical protein